MQEVSAAFQLQLESDSRDLSDVYEVYEYDHLPNPDFDPADAIARYAHIDLEWNGHAYDRQAVSRGPVSRFIGPTINNASLVFSNVNRTLAGFILNNDIEGMWCVVRRISRSVTNSSLVLFVGKFQRPGELDKQKCSISVRQFLGSTDYELPLRIFRTDDPSGRLPDDPLFEGFRFIPISGTAQFQTREPRRLLGFIPFGKKTVTHSKQWSSFSDTPLGNPIPEVVGGRCQVPGIPIMFADIGTSIMFLMVGANGKVHDIVDIKNQTRGFGQPHNVTIHLGEPGNTGTQTADPQFPAAGYFSGTAYIGGAVDGSDPANVDGAPTITMVVMAEVDLPDEDGNFTEAGFSDNPIYVTRNYLTKSKFLNVPPELIDDEANAEEVLFCDSPLVDDANTNRVFLPTDAHALAVAGEIRRWRSTALVDVYRVRHWLGIDSELPELLEPEYEEWDGLTPPVIDVIRNLRKRYTLNATLTDTVGGLDYLHKTLLPAFRGYLLTGSNGKIKIKIKKSADSMLLRAGTVIGATEIPVENVEPWRTSLQGQILIGVGRNNSEVRRVTGTRYSTAGNSITLSASGGVTASGATFSGGNGSTIPSAATLTVTSDSGTKTVTIDSVPVEYATIGDDTTGTVGAMLAAGINSDPTLNRYISASWTVADPTHVYLQAKLGFLQLESALEFAHSIEEETIRVMFSFSDRAFARANCSQANIRKDTFNWPLGTREKPINQVKGKFHDSRNDFAETPYELNNTPNQIKVRKILPEQLDFSAIDNVHHASRIARGRYAEVAGTYYPDLFDEPLKGATFFSWGASARGVSLLIEEGDVGCVTNSSGGPNMVNIPVRAEDIQIPQKGGPDITARLYATEMYEELVPEQVVPLPTTLANPLATESPVFDSVDNGVPVVTVAPTIRLVDFQEQWSVYYPNPDSKGFSLVDSEVQVRRTSDLSVLLTRPNGRTNNIVITQYAFDCKIRYRWRNQYRESGSDGWSSWSPDANAFGIGSATPNDPESELPTFNQDPNDVFNPHGREVLFP
jgi:hypothetical protein